MSWNYRVVRHLHHGEEEFVVDEYFQIHEVYYDDAGNPKMWSEDAMKPLGDTVDELAVDLTMFAKALELPVLNAEDLPGNSKN